MATENVDDEGAMVPGYVLRQMWAHKGLPQQFEMEVGETDASWGIVRLQGLIYSRLLIVIAETDDGLLVVGAAMSQPDMEADSDSQVHRATGRARKALAAIRCSKAGLAGRREARV
jgi:hypothetical protein